jgi:diacylglycerol kinase family enzyme
MRMAGGPCRHELNVFPSPEFRSVRVTLMHNPAAGDESQPTREELLARIERAGHQVRYQSVQARGWTRALTARADLVAVAGGDGAVGRVARRMLGRREPLAILPTGTANNIARTLGLAGQSVDRLVASWETGRPQPFDVGVARGTWRRRLFLEGAGFGLLSGGIAAGDTQAPSDRPGVGDDVRRNIQKLRTLLKAFAPVDITATLDGQDVSGRYLLFVALLARFIGPSLPLAARRPGTFGVVMVTERERRKLDEHLAAWARGARGSRLAVKRGRQLCIHWTGATLHVDDKPWPEPGRRRPKPPAEIELTIARDQLRFLVPSGAAPSGAAPSGAAPSGAAPAGAAPAAVTKRAGRRH